MMVREKLGGYCPEDPNEFAFMSTVIAFRSMNEVKQNTNNRLQNLINKSR